MQAIRSRRRTAALCTAGAALSLAAFAPSAFAGNAQVSGGQLSYTAGVGELNDVKLTQTSATQVLIQERSGQAVTPGLGCFQATKPARRRAPGSRPVLRSPTRTALSATCPA